jgi:ABC-2 type transport system ATP-binding protein
VPDTPAVSVDGLVMRYGDKVAVDGLSLTVEQHTITAVLGPNGAGKTTTLETCEGYRSGSTRCASARSCTRASA